MPDPKPFGVKPLDAITFLKNKLNVPTARWNDIWQDMHGAAFMVAGAQKAALIEDFHAAVTSALENGSTLAKFRKDFDQIVAKHGWDYNGSRNWRSKIIYRTNMDMARSAGQWASIQRVKKSRPYIRYDAVMDGRTRPQHRAWNDIVLPVDHPFWETHYPPNGWLCRCQPRSLSERDLKRQGLKVSDDPKIIWEDREVKRGDGKIVIVPTPQGIHTGFAYNPGIAGFGRGSGVRASALGSGFEDLEAPGAKTRADYPPLPIVEADIPVARPLPQYLINDVEGNLQRIRTELQGRLREVLGGDEAVYIDPAGQRVRITQALVDHIVEKLDFVQQRERFFPLMPEIITDPAEIWMGWARGPSGKVELRRRYVKLIRIGKNRVLGLVADTHGGEWRALTFFSGRPTGANNLRTGMRVWPLE